MQNRFPLTLLGELYDIKAKMPKMKIYSFGLFIAIPTVQYQILNTYIVWTLHQSSDDIGFEICLKMVNFSNR